MARDKIFASPPPAINSPEDMFVCECYLLSGGFESKIQLPLSATEREKQDFIEAWMAMMTAGLKITVKG